MNLLISITHFLVDPEIHITVTMSALSLLLVKRLDLIPFTLPLSPIQGRHYVFSSLLVLSH